MSKQDILKLSLGAVTALALGCAPNVGTIDRTQPNALQKSQFEGLWFYRAMVTDADPESGTIAGISGNTDKIRWEITENHLVGYRTYEFVPYAEGLTDDGRDFFGSPVVGYRILSHFDIRRDYNTTTGVESNVIVENTTDRPWHERQYIRVDWSENTVGNGAERFWIGWSNYPDAYFSRDSTTKYYVQPHEETDPDRPIFTQDYFDITNRYSVSADPYYCATMLLFNSVPRCGHGQVKVRLAFRKIDPNDDYESLYYPDVVELKDDEGNAIIANFDGRSCESYDPSECSVRTFPYDAAYGNFRNLRVAFDQERLLTRTGRIFMAGRFDIWQDSYNAEGSLIPYTQRQPKPVIYYGNPTFPADMIPPAQRMAQSWAKPFEETVAHLKGYRNSDGSLDVGKVQTEAGGPMYQFRQNDCNPTNIVNYARTNNLLDVVERVAGSEEDVKQFNVEKVCAAIQFAELENGATLDPKVAQERGLKLAFTWQRLGDLRFNFQNYVHPNVAGPWGVAQFAQDPETGEFIGANVANYFGNAGDTISQREVDILQWLNGDLSEEELFRGDITREAVTRRRGARNASIRQQVKNMLMAQDADAIDAQGDSLHRVNNSGDTEEARFSRMFKGTDIERDLLVTDDILRSFAGPTLYQPSGALAGPGQATGSAPVPGVVSPEAMEAASPVNWGMTPQSNEFMQAAYEFGRRTIDMASFFDPNSAGLADFFKGEDREVINQWLRVELYAAVNGHEVGHTVGLRHNFEASMDALNYKPEFWWRENPDGTVTQYWNNPPTPENPNRSVEYKYASIMDYGFDIPNEGLYGIGTYDEAAIRFMYGQLIEVWDPEKVSLPDPRKYGSFARRCGHDDDFWGVDALLYFMGPKNIAKVLATPPKDQSGCSDNYDDDTSCDTDIDALFRELVVRVEANAERNNLPSQCTLFFADLNWLMSEVKKLEPNARNVYDARKIVTVGEYLSQQIEVMTDTPEYDDPSTVIDEASDDFDDDNDGRVDDKGYDWSRYYWRVNHAYCSDLYASFSNPFCQRWDTGWNFTESTDYHINRWHRDYVFAHFRRDAVAPWTNGRRYMMGLQARRLYHLTNVYRYYLYTRRTAFEADLYTDWAEAAYKGINALERIVQSPEPGRYCLGADNVYRLAEGAEVCDRSRDNPNTSVNEAEYTVGVDGLGFDQGAYLNDAWTNEYFYKANRIGSFYDKLAAIQQMTTSSGFFARDLSDLFDRRSFSLGYLRVYLDPMLQRFAALIQGDHTGYRPHVVLDDDNERFVRYTPFFDEDTEDGGSVREWLREFPEIEPSWSWSLQYFALAYAIANWSSVNDYAPEMYRFTKISIRGTPEDVDYPADMTVVEFTDPETFITYRAPQIAPFSPGGLVQEFPAYYGDRFHRERLNQFRNWGVGANLLTEANNILENDWRPSRLACEDGTGVGAGERWATREAACTFFERTRSLLNEKTDFIDRVRKFNLRAEGL